jgi:nucleoside-diphosphate-sugar epimerase
MRVLLTGASSFTGYWFVRELAAAGHSVTACLASPETPTSYAGVRGERVHLLHRLARREFAAPMGSAALLQLIRNEPPFDAFCHHWAQVQDYRSPDYDVLGAVAAATERLPEMLRALKDRGCGQLILTGSVFEEDEGAGNQPLRAFSPYGLAKSLTWRYLKFYGEREGVGIGKFVIANPFGPYEEPRFTDYLMRSWCCGEAVRVATPRYVRDNIHVDLLAKAYAAFVAGRDRPGALRRIAPSGYPESQGTFARRVAGEVAPRLGLACAIEFGEQSEFPEPMTRIGTDVPDAAALGWSESAAWDAFAEYYRARYSGGRR